MGAVMVRVAVAMLADLDSASRRASPTHLPAVLVNPTQSARAARRGRARGWPTCAAAGPARRGGAAAAAPAQRAAGARQAPEFIGKQRWFNTPGDRPLTLAGLRGRVVLVDFWTYTCINCLRTLPYLKAWDAQLPRATG